MHLKAAFTIEIEGVVQGKRAWTRKISGTFGTRGPLLLLTLEPSAPLDGPERIGHNFSSVVVRGRTHMAVPIRLVYLNPGILV